MKVIRVLAVVAAVAVAAVAAAASGEADFDETDVVVLTDDNFADFINNDLALVEFYAPCTTGGQSWPLCADLHSPTILPFPCPPPSPDPSPPGRGRPLQASGTRVCASRHRAQG